MATAIFVKDLRSRSGLAICKLYRVDPPMDRHHDYVIVSAVKNRDYLETAIFASDQYGIVRHWYELPGSFVGAQDHERALREAGYEILTKTHLSSLP